MSTFDLQSPNPKKILFQLSGSIACFKACALLSSLVKAGFDIEVIATASALKFVGEATLEGLTGRRIHTSTFESGGYMDHIHLVRWADLVLLCPASANTLNKLAAGLADDLVSTAFLAHDFKKPYLIAPAMNQTMYAHPATQSSLRTLANWGVEVLETGTGLLACGENGEGRMLEPVEIQTAIESALQTQSAVRLESKTSPRARKILITSGGTQEPIDTVRSITNTSTGKTGSSLAAWFAESGHDVTLLHARSAAIPAATSRVRLIPFESFSSLQQSMQNVLATVDFDAVIHLAAVADYSLDEIETNGVVQKAPLVGKLDSSDKLILKLKKNPKLVTLIKGLSRNPNVKVVAFKLTSTRDQQARRLAIESLSRLAEPDFIVHNDLSEIGNGGHPFTVYRAHHAVTELVAQANGARDLAKALSSLLEARPEKKQAPHFERNGVAP